MIRAGLPATLTVPVTLLELTLCSSMLRVTVLEFNTVMVNGWLIASEALEGET